MLTPKVKRTYGSRQNRPLLPPSSPSTLPSPIATPALKQKRPFDDHLLFKNIPPPSKRAKVPKKNSSSKETEKQKTLTQLHFCIEQSILRTCPLCDLSYSKGAPEDEDLHRAHCARVRKGMEWGREEEKERNRADVAEVCNGLKLKDGRKGRIICFKADVGGKIGLKLTTLLATINLALSSPPLTPAILRASKAYLFLLPPTSSTSPREKIVGCVIAQHISTAMAIASPIECDVQFQQALSETLVAVDTSTGLFCHPSPLPTPLGISRVFVPSTNRRQRIAHRLLSAVAETFVHGCQLDPQKGQIAFTQPTGDGTALMRSWGGDGVRIYEE